MARRITSSSAGLDGALTRSTQSAGGAIGRGFNSGPGAGADRLARLPPGHRSARGHPLHSSETGLSCYPEDSQEEDPVSSEEVGGAP
jgi:hypothetical protein